MNLLLLLVMIINRTKGNGKSDLKDSLSIEFFKKTGLPIKKISSSEYFRNTINNYDAADSDEYNNIVLERNNSAQDILEAQQAEAEKAMLESQLAAYEEAMLEAQRAEAEEAMLEAQLAAYEEAALEAQRAEVEEAKQE